MKSFALVGAAGYVAPRHLRAIKDTNNNLLAALDPFDSVGIIDSYFPNANFFVEFERFDRHIEKLHRSGEKIDFITVCSPNYLHDSHIRFGLRIGANVICEKPIVLNPWNIDALTELEKGSEGNIYSILQLRLHPSVIDLRDQIKNGPPDKIYDIDLTYLTARGNWYYTSWKGDNAKSGGIATNIGIHFFDMLIWLFGDVKQSVVHLHCHDRASGVLFLENARVRWFLSINSDLLADKQNIDGNKVFRSITIEGNEFEFSSGFTDLHTTSYQEILNNNGFRISETRKSVDLVHDIRNAKNAPLQGDFHPLVKFPLSKHPFRH